ncbi:MAG: GYD domain-containing protein [Acidobacteria bacterium]|nr:GYD domain-containing protein [Acidobacteriota bacterium]
MATFLLQAAYTSEAWSAMVKNPQDRRSAIDKTLNNLGGKMLHTFLSFGDYDIVSIVDLPNNVSAAAFSLAASAGGAVKSIKTTPLLTYEEGMEAMRKAAQSGYQPPMAMAKAAT